MGDRSHLIEVALFVGFKKDLLTEFFEADIRAIKQGLQLSIIHALKHVLGDIWAKARAGRQMFNEDVGNGLWELQDQAPKAFDVLAFEEFAVTVIAEFVVVISGRKFGLIHIIREDFKPFDSDILPAFSW